MRHTTGKKVAESRGFRIRILLSLARGRSAPLHTRRIKRLSASCGNATVAVMMQASTCGSRRVMRNRSAHALIPIRRGCMPGHTQPDRCRPVPSSCMGFRPVSHVSAYAIRRIPPGVAAVDGIPSSCVCPGIRNRIRHPQPTNPPPCESILPHRRPSFPASSNHGLQPAVVRADARAQAALGFQCRTFIFASPCRYAVRALFTCATRGCHEMWIENRVIHIVGITVWITHVIIHILGIIL